jgi:hypothetical protein
MRFTEKMKMNVTMTVTVTVNYTHSPDSREGHRNGKFPKEGFWRVSTESNVPQPRKDGKEDMG